MLRHRSGFLAVALVLGCSTDEPAITGSSSGSSEGTSGTAGDGGSTDDAGDGDSGDGDGSSGGDGDGSSGGDGDGTTGDGTTGDGTTGDGDGCNSTPGTYGDCVNNAWPAICGDTAAGCVVDDPADPSFGACFGQACTSDCDCWAAPAGATAEPRCSTMVLANSEPACVLDCSGGLTCPTGMRCEAGLNFCVWDVIPGDGDGDGDGTAGDGDGDGSSGDGDGSSGDGDGTSGDGDGTSGDGSTGDGDGTTGDGDGDGMVDPCLSFAVPAPGLSVVYVDDDATGTGDGSSWANAYTTVSEALATAVAGSQVRVAAGRYVPPTNNVAVATLKSNIAVYGGWAGTEAIGDPRPTPLAITIFDGDRLGDDPASLADNSWHVVSAVGVSNARLDGVTITGGNAVAGGDGNLGGGVYADTSTNVVLRHLVVRNNTANQHGGGIYLNTVDVNTVADVELDANSATRGGGLYSLDEATILCSNIHHNDATGAGAGVYFATTSTVETTTIADNLATNDGGGLFAFSGLTILDSTFARNEARDGGGIFNVDGTFATTVTGTTFEGNIARGSGGGGAWGREPLTITGSTFTANEAAIGGGAGLRYSGSSMEPADVVLTDVTFDGNITTGALGGTVYMLLQGSLTSTRVDVLNSQGGGVYLSADCTSAVTWSDSTISGNTGGLGAGLRTSGGNVELHGLTISGNTSSSRGGGAYLSTPSTCTDRTALYDSDVRMNGADEGGGLYVLGTDVWDTVIEGNTATSFGGGVASASDASLVNLTFTNNSTAADMGAGLSVVSTTAVHNCVFFANGGDDIEGEGSATVTNCCSEEVLGADPTNTSLVASPFEVGSAGELFLADTATACIDAGDASYVDPSFAWDTMTTRLSGALDATPIDMGAHYPVP